MTGNEVQRKILAALAAVRDCAEQMENSADGLVQALSAMPMDEILRATSLETSTGSRLNRSMQHRPDISLSAS